MNGRGNSLPDNILELADSGDDHFFESESELPFSQRDLLVPKYHVIYVFTCELSELAEKLKSQITSVPTVQIIKVSNDNREEALAFIENNYYRAFWEYHQNSDVERFYTNADSYFLRQVEGRLYVKSGKVVSCVLVNRYEEYPLLKRPTIHFGYAGYERNDVSREEANWIKSDWLSAIQLIIKPGDVIDASINSFNNRALRAAKSLGFRQVGVRLEKK